ncbi:MAG: hypothetical protein EOP61_18210 [Sphingomonadales bacterium]|nr:MAG: hypothetical protein EOP61_18210 [Sphingomonadales bacterium]
MTNGKSLTWRVQPNWVKKLTLFVGLPVWLALGAMIITGKFFEWQAFSQFLFCIFSGVAVTQLFFVGRAFWRNDI